ncbi:hypothetical protein EIP91_008440 [Steccherinum ochraceum]|uniref:Xylanolytic transcriptional activator regulatory domain-containing protein n=1 Tax=Steccherinum ochraceum TaxID=92696 RepID=A0A4R0R554_9APHY|nr:hypothetical protein EIP91_008440 [Steccherinum ochraceum]
MVQRLQANVLLCFYYWWQAKWVEVYTRVAATLRISVALGLNLAPQFTGVTPSSRPASLIPPPTTAIEEEMRRNTFWIAYALERQYGTSNGWALSLDDNDILQLFPMSEQYDGGMLDLTERQLCHTTDALLIHPPNQTDSFVLYIKSAMLLSQVKNFNLRTRSKYYAQDPSVSQSYPLSDVRFDPRETPEFGAICSLALAFGDSLPSLFKTPTPNGVVDPFIYSVLLSSPISLILLHEQYAMVGKDSCMSAYHILTSARTIATLLHVLVSANYDCTRLGLFPVFAWFTSARVLTRFLRAALEEKYAEQVRVLTDEITFILTVLRRLGDRMGLSGRYAKMLEDHVLKLCGPEAAAKVCITDSPEPPDNTGFAPEMQEGEAADKILRMRLASFEAIKAAGQVFTPSMTTPFWPNMITAPVP